MGYDPNQPRDEIGRWAEVAGANARKVAGLGEVLTVHAYRGVDKTGPADPGDLGIGTYYSTSISAAKQYGTLTESGIHLSNALRLNGEQAFKLTEKYGTLHGLSTERLAGAAKLTRDLVQQGYDGLILDGWDSPPGYITVVVFPKAK